MGYNCRGDSDTVPLETNFLPFSHYTLAAVIAGFAMENCNGLALHTVRNIILSMEAALTSRNSNAAIVLRALIWKTTFLKGSQMSEVYSCASHQSVLTVVGRKNMGWRFSDQKMLATIQGVKFLSHKKFKKLRNI